MNKQESSFGKGLVYNLVLFSEHFGKIREIYNIDFVYNHKDKDKILVDNPSPKYNYGFNKEVKWWFDQIMPIWGSYEKALSQKIRTWANGATDHLYEIQGPKKWERKKIVKLIRKLQNKGLEIGHGYTEKIWTIEDLTELMNLTKEIAFLIDEQLGVNPIRGEWE